MLHHSKASDSDTTSELLRTKKPKKKMRKPKAYFYGVTREQGSFDWFRGAMRDFEETDNKESIEMHNYLTGVYEEGNARSSLVMMLQSVAPRQEWSQPSFRHSGTHTFCKAQLEEGVLKAGRHA